MEVRSCALCEKQRKPSQPTHALRAPPAPPQLGVCVTVLKQRCREFGIARWPYRKVRFWARAPSSQALLAPQDSPGPRERAPLRGTFGRRRLTAPRHTAQVRKLDAIISALESGAPDGEAEAAPGSAAAAAGPLPAVSAVEVRIARAHAQAWVAGCRHACSCRKCALLAAQIWP